MHAGMRMFALFCLVVCGGCTASGVEGDGVRGPKGEPGPAGPQGLPGPPGSFDVSQVIANGNVPQDAGFHITGNGLIGGRLGIRKTAPAAALDVAGGISGAQFGEVWRTGTLEPGASSEEFNLNLLWNDYGNVGVITVFMGTEGVPSDNTWVVAINAYGVSYNSYKVLAGRVTSGFDVLGLTATTLDSRVTFHNTTALKARYAINRLPLLVNHRALLEP